MGQFTSNSMQVLLGLVAPMWEIYNSWGMFFKYIKLRILMLVKNYCHHDIVPNLVIIAESSKSLQECLADLKYLYKRFLKCLIFDKKL